MEISIKSIVMFCFIGNGKLFNKYTQINLKVYNIYFKEENQIKKGLYQKNSSTNFLSLDLSRNEWVLIETIMLPITTRDKYRNFISGQGQTINLQGSLISKQMGLI